ncbi:MAG: DUF5681 domain-containing protein [Pseudomonadota bacterium]
MSKFVKGSSGNPRGRPRGIADRRTALRSLLEPHSEALVQKAVQLALAGDTTALKACLDRLIPPIRPVDAPLPIDGLSGTLTEQGNATIQAMAEGRLGPADAAHILSSLASQVRLAEMDDLEKRMSKLEEHYATA